MFSGTLCFYFLFFFPAKLPEYSFLMFKLSDESAKPLTTLQNSISTCASVTQLDIFFKKTSGQFTDLFLVPKNWYFWWETPFINSFNNVRVKNRDAQLQKPSLMSFNISNCFPIGPFWKDEGSKNLLYWQKLPYLKAMLDIFYFAGVPGCYCVLCYCVFAHTAVCLSTQEIDAGEY